MSDKYWQISQRDIIYNRLLGVAEKRLSSEYQRCFEATKRQIIPLYDEIITSSGTADFLISDLYKFNRYYELMNALNEALTKLGKAEIEITEDILTEMYFANVQLITDELGLYKISGVFPEENNMKLAIEAVWCQDGKHWSDRIWANKAVLQERVKNGLIDCVARGVSRIELVNELMKNINIGFREADRLARTELTFIQNQAIYDRYKEAGISEYKYAAYLDKRTSEVCKNLNGKIFNMADAQVGVNFPPLHPNCRSTVLAVI